MSIHSTVPAVRHLTTLTVTMLTACAALMAEDAAQPAAQPAAENVAVTTPGANAEQIAELHYQQGLAALEKLDLTTAVQHLSQACDWQPGNPTYRAALERARTLAGSGADPRGARIASLANELAVKQEAMWAEAQMRVSEGEKALETQDFSSAERAFSMAQIRLENLPIADSRREPELRRVGRLLDQTRVKRVEQERQRSADQAQEALDRKRELREASLKIERDRIDALLRRAQKARERRDYDEAILLCENVIKLNRAEDRAQALLAKCRRERHVYLRQVTADRWDEEHKLLSENIRASMLPQLEIVNYSPDWYRIDALRSAPTQGAEAENEEWRKRITDQLEQKVSVTFDGMEMIDVVAALQKLTGVNIVLDPQVASAGAGSVTLKVADMQLKYVLDYIVKMTNLNYSLRDEALFISNAQGARGGMFMKIYDIRDLTHEVQNFPGPDLSIPDPQQMGNGGGGAGGSMLMPALDTAGAKKDVNSFIELIKKVVAPSEWEGDNAGRIEDYSGSMVVTHTATVQKQIEQLLRTLRNQQASQVHVKVKFLSVENSFLEEIGVNWQNFNVANAGDGSALPGQTTTNGAATPFGAYKSTGSVIGAGSLSNQLSDYSIAGGITTPGNSSTSNPSGGMALQTQYWNVGNNTYLSAVLNAVEKERHGNVMFEPDITMFNGERAHVTSMTQQSYISSYEVNQNQYDPQISSLSYGTVLDVQPIISSDKKFITLTVQPTHSEVVEWRSFQIGFSPTATTTGGSTPSNPNGTNTQASIFAPMTMPEISFQAVRTSVTIPDGGSILLAGMNTSASKRVHTGVPFLSHIPFLGRLFSSNGRNERLYKTIVVLQADIVLYDEIEKKL